MATSSGLTKTIGYDLKLICTEQFWKVAGAGIMIYLLSHFAPHLVQNHQHITTPLEGEPCSAVIGGTPKHEPGSSSGYVWLFNSLHILAGNLSTAVSAKFPALSVAPGTSVVVLLPSVPVSNTIAVQFHTVPIPPDEVRHWQNIIWFDWDEPSVNLREHNLYVSYFPDPDLKPQVQALSFADGQVVADGKPVPNGMAYGSATYPGEHK